MDNLLKWLKNELKELQEQNNKKFRSDLHFKIEEYKKIIKHIEEEL